VAPAHRAALRRSTLSGSWICAGWSVGGGHKKRALAHGYSMSTLSGFRGGRDV
jgi:hypothetical protein